LDDFERRRESIEGEIKVRLIDCIHKEKYLVVEDGSGGAKKFFPSPPKKFS
jgi:hypothetical protein